MFVWIYEKGVNDILTLLKSFLSPEISKVWCVKPWSQGWLIAAGAYPGFCSMKRLEVFLEVLPLDGMLVHRRSLPRNFVRFPQQIAGTHLYTWVERGTVRVKCLAQEHNTLSPARARTRTARSGVERTNHEATASPTLQSIRYKNLEDCQSFISLTLLHSSTVYFAFFPNTWNYLEAFKVLKIKERDSLGAKKCVFH